MEQMFLVEIFVDKVTVYVSENDSNAGRGLTLKIRFGPKTEFIIKEGQLAVTGTLKEDTIECGADGKRKWSRIIRVGKSFLFPSYPDTVMMILKKFPLEIELWDDDDRDEPIFVGKGEMAWDTQFYYMLKETNEACKRVEPLTIKQKVALYAECCCKVCAEVSFILRLGSLGESIITEFQQLMNDPDYFVFRTNRAPSMFKCSKIEGDDKNFNMVGSLYESTTLEDPEMTVGAADQIEICTDLKTCGHDAPDYSGKSSESTKTPKKFPIDKIRMGDITGPCGNSNCPLAHKVKQYLRQLNSYKKAASDVKGTKQNVDSKKICGTCKCTDDRWHRDICPDTNPLNKVKCPTCGGQVTKGSTCPDHKNKIYGDPLGKNNNINYVFDSSRARQFHNSIYGKDYTINHYTINKKMSYNSNHELREEISNDNSPVQARSQTVLNWEVDQTNDNPYKYIGTNNFIYNVATSKCSDKEAVDEKGCKCNPPKPIPPCKTFDCDCIEESVNIAARKAHKPFCPRYKHKTNCPVNLIDVEEQQQEEENNDVEPLPYGLPPLNFGPCPVLGRPCTIPDGFQRMYKTAVQPVLPPSYSQAGKVCCTKEFERIKKAIKEYMKKDKTDDFRCVNKFNVETERRCCDKEQNVGTLVGRSCCGGHKMAIQEKFKDKPEK